MFIEFPRGIGQGELPPLFVIGPEGEGQLVNYRVRQNYMIVDRRGLFGGHPDGAVLVDPAGRSDGGGS